MHASNVLHQTNIAIHEMWEAERDGEAIVAIRDVNQANWLAIACNTKEAEEAIVK